MYALPPPLEIIPDENINASLPLALPLEMLSGGKESRVYALGPNWVFKAVTGKLSPINQLSEVNDFEAIYLIAEEINEAHQILYEILGDRFVRAHAVVIGNYQRPFIGLAQRRFYSPTVWSIHRHSNQYSPPLVPIDIVFERYTNFKEGVMSDLKDYTITHKITNIYLKGILAKPDLLPTNTIYEESSLKDYDLKIIDI